MPMISRPNSTSEKVMALKSGLELAYAMASSREVCPSVLELPLPLNDTSNEGSSMIVIVFDAPAAFVTSFSV